PARPLRARSGRPSRATRAAAGDPTMSPYQQTPATFGDDARPASRLRALGAIVKVIELRLRFIVLMAGTGLVFGYWEPLSNLLEKWRRAPEVEPAVVGRYEYFCPMHPSVIDGRPAQCPSCGMALARRERGAGEALPEGILSRFRLEPRQVA